MVVINKKEGRDEIGIAVYTVLRKRNGVLYGK